VVDELQLAINVTIGKATVYLQVPAVVLTDNLTEDWFISFIIQSSGVG
jgi:hypothetical protein